MVVICYTTKLKIEIRDIKKHTSIWCTCFEHEYLRMIIWNKPKYIIAECRQNDGKGYFYKVFFSWSGRHVDLN